MVFEVWIEFSVGIALLSPFLLLVGLSLDAIVSNKTNERSISRAISLAMRISFTSLLFAFLLYWFSGAKPRSISYGQWFSSGEASFAIDFLIDGMSLTFALLATTISGIVSAFSSRYLHRETGYKRYFVLFAMFVTGIQFVSLAGSIEVLFAGWELLGLSSALLVAFFHERASPVQNALRVFAVYRISDASMLAAAVLLHHSAGSGSLSMLFGSAQTGALHQLSGYHSTLIAILLIAAVAGKSALLPFSGWLPRAMEGPTPSSAVYYGSLSIHAGCFLLLRAAPLLEQSLAPRILVFAAGATTALYATITARVQTDVKSSLSYAALTQVGIIIVEISLGFYNLAFIHIIGHASFRLLQFLSAPNALHDLHELENAAGGHFQPTGKHLETLLPEKFRQGLYLIALERGFLDAILDRFVVGPFLKIAQTLDRLDRFLCDVAVQPGMLRSFWKAKKKS